MMNSTSLLIFASGELRSQQTLDFALIINFIKAITKTVTRKVNAFFISLRSIRLRQSIRMRLSLPRATPKLARSLPLVITFLSHPLPRLCQTLNLSSMFVSLSIEENPKTFLLVCYFVNFNSHIRIRTRILSN